MEENKHFPSGIYYGIDTTYLIRKPRASDNLCVLERAFTGTSFYQEDNDDVKVEATVKSWKQSDKQDFFKDKLTMNFILNIKSVISYT